MEKHQLALEKYKDYQIDEAFEMYQDLVEEEKSVTNLVNMAYFYMHEFWHYEDAVAYPEEAVQKNPQTYFAYAVLGECMMELEKEEEAIGLLEKAYEMSQKDMLANNIATCYYNLADYEKANKWMEKVIKMGELDWYKKAIILYKLGTNNEKDISNVLKKYEESLNELDDEDKSHYWVAELYAAIGKYKKANECYKKEFTGENFFMTFSITTNYLFVLLKNNEIKKYKERIEKEIKRREEDIKKAEEEKWEDYEGFVKETKEELKQLEKMKEKKEMKKMKEEYKIKIQEKLEACGYKRTKCYFFGCNECGNPLCDEK